MSGREVVLWFVVAVAVGWGAVWQLWGATIATVAVAVEVAMLAAEIFGFHHLRKRDERRSSPPDAPKE
jgi:uncharacterized membrane protein YcjF (UPF0283 family)